MASWSETFTLVMKVTGSARACAGILGAYLLTTTASAEQEKPAPEPASRVLVVGIKDAPPFAMKQSNNGWHGISVDLWQKVAIQRGYSFRFVEEATVQGLLLGTSSGRFDVAVGALTVTSDREQIMDFAQSFYSTGLGIAVSTDGVLNWMPVVRTMTSLGFLQAVVALVGLTLMTGFVVWLIERRANEAFPGNPRGLTSSIWWSTLAMTQRSPGNSGPQTMPGRIVAIVWIVASIIALAVLRQASHPC